MLARNEGPWIEYLEIDEKTRERRLRQDTPEEICKKYEEYVAEMLKLSEGMLPK